MVDTKEHSLWAAKGPNGEIIRSSISTFRQHAYKHAIRKRNYEVVKLGSIKAPFVSTAHYSPVKETGEQAQVVILSATAEQSATPGTPVKRGPGRPKGSKNKTKAKRGPGRPPKSIAA